MEVCCEVSGYCIRNQSDNFSCNWISFFFFFMRNTMKKHLLHRPMLCKFIYLKKDPDHDHDQWSCPFSWPEGYSGKWYPNGALEIVLLWNLIDKYKKDYYERPHIERLTNSRGVNRREATFMETQNLQSGCFSSSSSSSPRIFLLP